MALNSDTRVAVCYYYGMIKTSIYPECQYIQCVIIIVLL